MKLPTLYRLSTNSQLIKPSTVNDVMQKWHDTFNDSDNFMPLAGLLADNVVFHSPVVHTPLEGKDIALKYLKSATVALNNGNFRYIREVVGNSDAILEFVTELDMSFWSDEERSLTLRLWYAF